VGPVGVAHAQDQWGSVVMALDDGGSWAMVVAAAYYTVATVVVLSRARGKKSQRVLDSG
jgi:hypothetical protein